MVGHLFTEMELEFVLELLEAESQRLAVETIRTDASKLHKQLRERNRTVDRLIERLHEVIGGDYSP